MYRTRKTHQVLPCSCHVSETGNWSPSTGHDWKRHVNQGAERWVLSRCFLYVFRLEVVWLLVLQLSKAEDAYALHGATFGSRFQGPSIDPSSVREAQNDRQYKFPIFNTYVDALLYKCKDWYTSAVNVLYKHTNIPQEAGHETIQNNVKMKTIILQRLPAATLNQTSHLWCLFRNVPGTKWLLLS